MSSSNVIPVILSGGSGTRLWPASRKHYPKQLLRVAGSRSMLQHTAARVAYLGAPLIVCNEDQRFMVAEQLASMEPPPLAIMLEPVARNTAPAIALAALQALESDDDPILVVLPADHLIQDEDSFRQALTLAVAQAQQDRLVIFGVKPVKAETGYGYIRVDGRSESGDRVKEFVEKPDAETAAHYVASGDYFWNSGMFVFRARMYLDELAEHEPAIVEACREAFAEASVDLDFIRLPRQAMVQCPSLSIDYAVMERTSQSWMIPLSLSWSDLGSWSSIWEVMDKDDDANVKMGDVVTEDCHRSLFVTEGRLVAAIGLDDLVVVDTRDALLLAPRDRVQDVKKLVQLLESDGREEHLVHREVFRPWGSYDSVDGGERYQVKRIRVKPGESLSLQMHHHRSEHWVVVQGTAEVLLGEETHLLSENQSIYIPLGQKHRLGNPGKVPLYLIEVQSGSYLGEDDIVRFEDIYGRS
jgi:mannose-1-phosphate guanylyltransferase/mannose-6-phosphate isomerase